MDSSHYKCLRCQHEWIQEPYPCYGIEGKLIGYSTQSDCPRCGHEYVEWLNYNELYGRKK